MSILLNPVVLSVLCMIVLCLLNMNVLFSLIIASLVAGITAGMPFNTIIPTLVGGMGANAETALSYILLGTFAFFINRTGLSNILAIKVSKFVTGKKYLFLMLIAFFACFSQNLIPVHIAFIPIMIPPLIPIMNMERIDRRAVACALTFALKAPYISLPVGFGLIFHNIIVTNLNTNGLSITLTDTSRVLWLLGLSMVIGLVIAVFLSYSKDRIYGTVDNMDNISTSINDDEKFTPQHYLTMLSAIIAFVVQLIFGSLVLGALVAVMFLAIVRVIKFSDLDFGTSAGISLMGFIAFVMLVASGYASVIKETGAIKELVDGVVLIVGGNKLFASAIMLSVGLFITLGIGTSFGTVPIIAAIYTPLAIELGFSVNAIIILVAAAGALGDAGSPASDSTLGPTSGLNMDGQHRHIWDTCVPTFLHFNIPIFLTALILSVLI